jgi:membrane protease YdiL (CAAX protease family)
MVTLWLHVASTGLILYWSVYRVANELRIETSDMLWGRYGLARFRLSGMAGFLIASHLSGLVLIAAMQQQIGRWPFSWANYQTSDGQWDMVRTVDMCVLAPWSEEVVFRAVMYSVLIRRIPARPVGCAVITNAVFGLIRMIHLVGSEFSPTYICLQSIMGTLAGTVYSLRFVLTESLWEPVILHTVNNVCSSCLPMRVDFDLNDLCQVLPLAITMVSLNLLILCTIYELQQRQPRPAPFPRLIPSAPKTPLPPVPSTSHQSAEPAALPDANDDAEWEMTPSQRLQKKKFR